jgi:indolepyruvate ferredoxin oxidoreductase
MLANVVLLGAAYQLGGLPLSLDHVDTAIRGGRPGGADDTRAAFEWGRWAAHDLAAVDACVEAAANGDTGPRNIFDPTSEALAAAPKTLAGRALPAGLSDLLLRRAAQAIDYQDESRANRFLDLVEEAARHDDAASGWALTRAIADSWFKLLTYKDEYEVARLHLKADYGHIAEELGIEGPYTVKYHLHPPTLRRMGLSKKLPMGKPYEMAFRALRHMKRLRETRFDPFGWDPDRRTERALIEEYERLVHEILDPGVDMPYDVQVRIAESVMAVKGYGEIKEAAVSRWRQEVSRLCASPNATVEASVT